MIELMRYSVLQTAVIAALLEGERPDPEVLVELDALTMFLAQRSRAAINFHETTSGAAALNDATQIVDALRAGDESAEWETRRWSLEQASNQIRPGMTPAEVVEHKRDLRGVKLLSDFTQPAEPIAAPLNP